jgi:hypothetical protein
MWAEEPSQSNHWEGKLGRYTARPAVVLCLINVRILCANWVQKQPNRTNENWRMFNILLAVVGCSCSACSADFPS